MKWFEILLVVLTLGSGIVLLLDKLFLPLFLLFF